MLPGNTSNTSDRRSAPAIPSRVSTACRSHLHSPLSRTRVLAHGDGTRIAQGFVRTVRAVPGIVRDDGREDCVRDVLGDNEARVKLLEI